MFAFYAKSNAWHALEEPTGATVWVCLYSPVSGSRSKEKMLLSGPQVAKLDVDPTTFWTFEWLVLIT